MSWYIIIKNLWMFEANISTQKDLTVFQISTNSTRVWPQSGCFDITAISRKPIFSKLSMILQWKLVRIRQLDYHKK